MPRRLTSVAAAVAVLVVLACAPLTHAKRGNQVRIVERDSDADYPKAGKAGLLSPPIHAPTANATSNVTSVYPSVGLSCAGGTTIVCGRF